MRIGVCSRLFNKSRVINLNYILSSGKLHGRERLAMNHFIGHRSIGIELKDLPLPPYDNVGIKSGYRIGNLRIYG